MTSKSMRPLAERSAFLRKSFGTLLTLPHRSGPSSREARHERSQSLSGCRTYPTSEGTQP